MQQSRAESRRRESIPTIIFSPEFDVGPSAAASDRDGHGTSRQTTTCAHSSSATSPASTSRLEPSVLIRDLSYGDATELARKTNDWYWTANAVPTARLLKQQQQEHQEQQQRGRWVGRARMQKSLLKHNMSLPPLSSLHRNPLSGRGRYSQSGVAGGKTSELDGSTGNGNSDVLAKPSSAASRARAISTELGRQMKIGVVPVDACHETSSSPMKIKSALKSRKSFYPSTGPAPCSIVASIGQDWLAMTIPSTGSLPHSVAPTTTTSTNDNNNNQDVNHKNGPAIILQSVGRGPTKSQHVVETTVGAKPSQVSRAVRWATLSEPSSPQSSPDHSWQDDQPQEICEQQQQDEQPEKCRRVEKRWPRLIRSIWEHSSHRASSSSRASF